MDKITIKAFQAPSEPALCEEFLREHRKVLQDFGIEHISTNTEDWMTDPNAYIIVALHDKLGMVGGIRLQIAAPDRQLPMSLAISKMDERVNDELAVLNPHGNGEVCSLWNANRYANMGIPVILSTCVTAMSTMVNARTMVCLVAHYTQRYPRRNGFLVMEGVGDKGTFIYPIPSITAIAMVNPDTLTLPYASDEQRHVIYSIRLRPQQVRIERPGKAEIEVHYDMRVQNDFLSLNAYQHIEQDRLRHSA
ncbi:MAG: hypothetical protein KDB88_13190 [Flavobacteriales bacterium]|nr:hypothetical protein [Flavobacteriales bacterium]